MGLDMTFYKVPKEYFKIEKEIEVLNGKIAKIVGKLHEQYDDKIVKESKAFIKRHKKFVNNSMIKSHNHIADIAYALFAREKWEEVRTELDLFSVFGVFGMSLEKEQREAFLENFYETFAFVERNEALIALRDQMSELLKIEDSMLDEVLYFRKYYALHEMLKEEIEDYCNGGYLVINKKLLKKVQTFIEEDGYYDDSYWKIKDILDNWDKKYKILYNPDW